MMRWQSHMNRNPSICIEQISVGNPELKMETSLIAFLENLKIRHGVDVGTGEDWEQAYNARSKKMAQQLIQIVSQGDDEALKEQMTEVAEFYQEDVVDPEMGPPRHGDAAAIRDFTMAVVSLLLGKPNFSEHHDRLEALLDHFS
jgi:hypothetical protein